MFPRRFFPARYFAPRFHPVGGAVVIPSYVAGGHCTAFVVHQDAATKFAVAQNIGIACTIQQSTATKFVIDPEG